MFNLYTITPAQVHPVLPERTGWKRIAQHPLARIFVALLFLLPVNGVGNLLDIFVIEPLGDTLYPYLNGLRAIVTMLLIAWAWQQYCRIVEKREAHEFGTDGRVKEMLTGMALSTFVIALIVGPMVVIGVYRIESFNSPDVLATSFLTFFVGALLQEMFFRVILFRMIEATTNSWIAVVLVAFIFGLLHFFNPNATLWTSAALMLSDLILAGCYLLTRRIWLVWGFHGLWNYLQAGVLGMSNSGVAFKSWIAPSIQGPDWLTGGTFGIEASVVGVIIQVMIGIGLLLLAHHRQQFVKLQTIR